MIPTVLTIAGSDPSGGAGIQADLKTFHQFGVYGTTAITLITVQNSVGVSRVELLPPDLILQQIDAVVRDLAPRAAKTGALGGVAAIEVIAAARLGCPLVADPVMISKHGAPLMAESARTALRELLLPRAALVTPNLHEASAIAGIEVDSIGSMKEAARRILDFGAGAVLVKGGHLEGDAVDVLFADGEFTELHAPRTETRHTHGTGCTYSAAIVARLALGDTLPAAVQAAKRFITEAIRTAPGLGAGCGPVNHWARSV
ncbi:MAG TPA: bifunctional hydroxymethylpyrimidine kinase/phosphomethylpyrimidine kinase [Bryobacteraceae bacterium]|nr:bifunctional hydroxymethylpyrimidine kinase/phosphomethylpyrimidine kinase [Bryobacteraceae bacterium]